MTAYQTIYAPTINPEDCEHFFPSAEELGSDPEAWTGPNPADCTGCGISYSQYQAEHEHHFAVAGTPDDVVFEDCACGTTFDEDQQDQWLQECYEQSRRA